MDTEKLTVKEFLKSKDVWKKFRRNVILLSGTNKEPEDVGIYGAFLWNSSPEGHSFWSNLNNEYNKLINGYIRIYTDSDSWNDKDTFLKLIEYPETEHINLVVVDKHGDILSGGFMLKISKEGIMKYHNFKAGCIKTCGEYVNTIEEL